LGFAGAIDSWGAGPTDMNDRSELATDEIVVDQETASP
jgi:hypothetical protein